MADAFSRPRFAVVPWGLGLLLRLQGYRDPAFREQLRRHDLVAQLRLADGSRGRCLVFSDGRVAARILKPRRDRLEFLNAAKNAQLELEGEGRFVTHFSNALSGIFSAGWKYGEKLSGRGRALHEQHQRRPGLRLRERRAHRANHADHLWRRRRRSLDCGGLSDLLFNHTAAWLGGKWMAPRPGTDRARGVVCLMAMQGLGVPGVSMGCPPTLVEGGRL